MAFEHELRGFLKQVDDCRERNSVLERQNEILVGALVDIFNSTMTSSDAKLAFLYQRAKEALKDAGNFTDV